MKNARSLIGAFLLLIAPVVARASDTGVLPFWSSDQVRAARSLLAENAVIFDLEVSVSTGGGTPETRHETITLGPSFTLVTDGGQNTLFDHAICRVLTWSSAKPTLSNDSCYSSLAFRVLEIRNRQYLREFTAKISSKMPDSVTQPYWAEVELGVQAAPNIPLAKSENGQAIEYRLGDAVVARVSGSTGPFTTDERRRFARFLALRTHVHPQVRHDIGAAATTFQRVEFSTYQGGKPQDEVLTVSNIRRTPVAYPLPPGLSAQTADELAVHNAAMQQGMRQTILAIEGKSSIPKPTAQALVASVRTAASSGRAMDGLFAFFQLTQQYPDLLSGAGADQTLLAALRPALPEIVKAEAVRPFWTANTLAGDQAAAGDRQASARYLATITLDGVPFRTIRYVTFVNLVGSSSDIAQWDPGIFTKMPKPLEDGYWLHIAAYPWSSFPFKDAGGFYLRNYDTPKAWLAFDLGRAVDPGWRNGPMVEIGKFEDQLRTNEPDFF